MSNQSTPRRNPVEESIEMLRDLSPQRQKQYAAALTVLSTLSDEDQDAVLDYINSHQMRITPYSVSAAIVEIQRSGIHQADVIDPSQHFTFEGSHDVRVIDRDGDLWFVAADACEVLDLENVSKAVSRLDDDEKDDLTISDVTGRRQQMLIISESGLYSLILTSRKPAAKRFKRWITHDVIPAIRKTGSYSAASSAVTPDMTEMEIVAAVANRMVEQERRIADLQRDQQITIERVDRLEVITHADADYYTIVGYRNLVRLGSATKAEARRLGKTATRLSRERGIEVREVYNPEWGTVHTYHISILQAVMGAGRRELPSGK